MKQVLALLAAAIFLLSVQAAFAIPSNLYWHSYDYYSIELNGNGNAFVVGTIQLEALSTQPVNTITLQIPYTDVTFYKVVENGIYENVCVEVPCAANQVCPPCIYQNSYKPSMFLNYTSTTLSDSTLITINLAYPVQNDTQTTLSLIFSTKNVAQKNFQGYAFNFKTVEDPNALIRSLSANVVVPQNMYLKGQPNFNIQYRPSEIASQALSAGPEAIARILPPYGGNAQYTASNLQPGESFIISGLYGDNLILLYAQEIGLGIIGLIILAIIVKYLFVDRARKMFSRRESEERVSRRSEFSFGRPIVVGIISSIIFVAVYYLLNFVFGSGYYYGNVNAIILLVMNAVFILISIFGLPYWLFSKYGKAEGVLAGIISLVLSFVLLILLVPQAGPVIYNLGKYASGATSGINVPATSGSAAVSTATATAS